MRIAARDTRCETVGFKVVLAHDENAYLVAQLIETARIRIVAGAHIGYVAVLEQLEVTPDYALGHGVAVVRVEIVAVDAADFERNAVEQNERTSARLAVIGRYLHFSEAEFMLPAVGVLTAGKSNTDSVEIRILMAPEFEVADRYFKRNVAIFAVRKGFYIRLGRRESCAVGAKNLDLELAAVELSAARLDNTVKLEHGGFEILRHLAAHIHILYKNFRLIDERHIAEDTGEAPHILILKITARAVAAHGDCKAVGARMNKVRYIVLALVESILRIADKFSVDKHFAARIDAAEVNEYIILGLGDLKLADIEPAGVELRLYVRDLRGGDCLGIIDIGIYRGVVALYLPLGRDFEIVERAQIKIGRIVALDDIVDALAIMEFPDAVEADGLFLPRLIARKTGRASRLCVDGIYVYILPKFFLCIFCHNDPPGK